MNYALAGMGIVALAALVFVRIKRARAYKWRPPGIRHGKMTRWLWAVWYPQNLFLGEQTDIGAFTFIQAKFGVNIGVGAQIGSHCSIYSESSIDAKRGTVVIGDYACVGSHSTVMPGVTVGQFAVVGANSFVNQDIPDGEVWAGCPVRKIQSSRERKIGFEIVEQNEE